MSSPTARRETSTWFERHAHVFARGTRVLDLACGTGRHAIAAARRGAVVRAFDWSEQRLAIARERAREAGVDIDWQRADLATLDLAAEQHDVVMVFKYLDRKRMPEFVKTVSPGGCLLYETFHVGQAALGWGPTSPEYLLQGFELPSLVRPLVPLYYREVVETVDTQSTALASVLARAQ